MKTTVNSISRLLHQSQEMREHALRQLRREEQMRLPCDQRSPLEVQLWEELLWYAYCPQLGTAFTAFTRNAALAGLARRVATETGCEPCDITFSLVA